MNSDEDGRAPARLRLRPTSSLSPPLPFFGRGGRGARATAATNLTRLQRVLLSRPLEGCRRLFPFLFACLAFLLNAGTALAQAPNIVFILTDDQDAASWSFMPSLQSGIVASGTLFPGYFNSVSLCCPSRATLLRGQYVHNHGVLTNRLPNGGYGRFLELELEASTIATWLQAAGYRTALFGKYLNGYPDRDDQLIPKTHVPPGWTEWASPVDGVEYSNFNYTLNENGTLVAYGAEADDYMTDVLREKAVDFIARRSAEPFFLYLATYAPHSGGNTGGGVVPAPRHATLFPDLQAPRPPSFNEEDVSDKPAHVRNLTSLSPMRVATIDRRYRSRIQSLQAIDEMIAAVIAALEQAGILDRTYVFYTADNGFMLGQHRIASGKRHPYEESIRAGLAVRGPNVPAGRVLPHLVGNVDLAPTFAALAGAPAPDFVDGRSLAALLSGIPPDTADWRRRFLIEVFTGGDGDGDDDGGLPEFHGVRTADRSYVEYAGGERELYDLAADPDQLANAYATAPAVQRCRLSAAVAALQTCAGERCRTAESEAERMAGDCDGDDGVTVNELVLGVRIALGDAPLAGCPAFDLDASRAIGVNELVRAVAAALGTC